jgi:AcrR family transcriptional regulator
VKKEAGVSTGAIYTYFPNKEAIIRALLEHAREERRRELEAATQTEGASHAEARVLFDWVTAIFGDEGRHRARVDVNLWAEALRSRRVRKLAQGALEEAARAVSTVVAARARDVLDGAGVRAESVAGVLIALFLGLEVQTAVGVRVDPGDVIRVLGALFSDYLPAFPAEEQRGSKRRRPRARR